ncbi:MAG TPA: DUF3011 domain-containing protein [Dokdonella sp.]
MSARCLLLVVALLFVCPLAAQARETGAIECRSNDFKYTECHTPFRSAGLVRQLSKTACIQEQTWGFNQQTGFVWVSDGCAGEFAEGALVDRGVYDDRDAPPPRHQDDRNRRGNVMECSSSGYKFTRCGNRWRSARLLKQLSDSACTENQSWGVDGEGLWVDQGCSGRFAEDEDGYDDRRSYSGSGYDHDAADGGGSTVTCESQGGDRERCGLPRGTREVHIDEQLSQAPCRRGENWDYDDRSIWVSDGCRARFRVW